MSKQDNREKYPDIAQLTDDLRKSLSIGKFEFSKGKAVREGTFIIPHINSSTGRARQANE